MLLGAAILESTGLTASAGVSINKFLAKMASGKNKPNGLTVILPEHAEAFVEELPIEKFHGIGQVTAAKMHELGIRTGAELKERSLCELIQHFGKVGHYYYKIARAQDDRVVEPNRIRKSIGAETSFAVDLSDVWRQAAQRLRSSMLVELEQIAQTVQQRLEQHQTSARTKTMKVKFSDYQQITRSKTSLAPISELSEIVIIARTLFEGIELGSSNIRLLGISLSNLDNVKEGQPLLPRGDASRTGSSKVTHSKVN